MLAILMLLSGCQQNIESNIENQDLDIQDSIGDEQEQMTEFGKPLVIGVSNSSNADYFDNLRMVHLKPLVDANDSMSITILDAAFDMARQLEQIDQFIEEDVDVAVIIPVDYDLVSSGIIKLNEAGIPVITLGVQAKSGDFCYIGSPNINAGRLQAEYIADVLPLESKVLYIEGDVKRYHSQERKEGFLSVLQSTRKDIQILDSRDGVYLESMGETIMSEWLTLYDDFDAVISANDRMALGAIKVLKEQGRLDGLTILGIDGSNMRALQAVEDGELTMTIYQDAMEQALQCYNVLESLSEGEMLPENIIIPFKVITKENVEEYKALISENP